MYAGVPGLSIEGAQNEARTARSQGAAVEAPAQGSGARAEEAHDCAARARGGYGSTRDAGPACKEEE
jgi:hypothetical protein